MGTIEKVSEFLLALAEDETKGYSQLRRTIGDSLDDIKDSDCSSSMISALRYAGFNTGKASYTGNLYPELVAMGFENVISTVNVVTGDGLQKYDIVLRPPTSKRGGHVFMYLGNGEIVQWAGDFDGKRGDSSNKETRVQSYYNSNPKYVMRLKSTTTSGEEACLFAVKLKMDLNVRSSPRKSNNNVGTASKGQILGISEVSADGAWGRIQNQISPQRWICITKTYVDRV